MSNTLVLISIIVSVLILIIIIASIYFNIYLPWKKQKRKQIYHRNLDDNSITNTGISYQRNEEPLLVLNNVTEYNITKIRKYFGKTNNRGIWLIASFGKSKMEREFIDINKWQEIGVGKLIVTNIRLLSLQEKVTHKIPLNLIMSYEINNNYDMILRFKYEKRQNFKFNFSTKEDCDNFIKIISKIKNEKTKFNISF